MDPFVKLVQRDRLYGSLTFQPVKIGHYSVAVGAAGFATTTKTGIELHVSERLEADIRLKVGTQAESVQVSAVDTPLLQTDDASTGQVMTAKQITDIPLNQRNYVFIAQLAAGVNPSNGSRGQGNGDFNANGQRATQNNFILDGVDNNSNAIDFLNGASYVVKPPPDALQEFKIQTSDSSAEFGHSAGGVVNATLKSGTNSFHGDVWEYIWNNDLEAPPGQWYAPKTPKALPYHQNQFDGTTGGPVLKNKLFFFFDYEGNRIVQDSPQLTTVPTALMESNPGNLTQLLNTTLTGQTQPIKLYEPGSGGTAILGSKCGNAANIMCVTEIDLIALTLFKMSPAANTGPAGLAYNNYAWNQATTNITNQIDARVDYNRSSSDQVFARVSWAHEDKTETTPLGPILDGGGTFSDGTFTNYAKNAVLSWNHVFAQTLTNQARFAYNWGYFNWLAQSANVNLAARFGFGGVPFQPSNGGLPNISISGINGMGTPSYTPSPEHQNVYQIIDDATKIWGNQSFKFGVNFQNIRYSVIQPTNAHTSPGFNGHITGQPGTSFTGSGIADYLADQQNSNNTSSFTLVNNGHWYRAAYIQDDWKVNNRLSLNLGVRYDFFQPPIERLDHRASFYPTGGIDIPGGGTGVYLMPLSQKNVVLSPIFLNLLAKDNITLKYTANRGSAIHSARTSYPE
ncbi:TonB-dependent receptor [Granulicella arctica]|uniref:Outer membrane receptor protein involved in Fe transport n=1 Tax=Granulicella arctica TaxID=940613 RepID=A0A7Y9PHJ3_9BACT|nr:TonB-dependent receptor [Granulicella arctica]NYF80017.1 outer membrane receptor protein involved in Fe transport [Granulicella arctica]